MDLNHIELPASLLANLYPSSLNEYNESPGKTLSAEVEKPILKNDEPGKVEWKWLGENKKNILIVVDFEDAVHLPDKQLQFLTGMLTACNLSLGDVAIVNIHKQPARDYASIIENFRSRIALLFDIEPAAFGLPMNFPFFQIQPFANCSFLYAPSLEQLESDKVLKSKLWVSLRRLFGI